MTAATETSAERREFTELWANPRGVRAFFTVVQHKTVGTRYMVTAFVFFLIGGVEGLLMRTQLAVPENDFLSPQTYNELFTMHGSTMMFLFAVPFLEGLANWLVPLMIGSRDLPFPVFNAFNYWCYLLGGVLLYSSFLFALVPATGWFSYVPLSGPEFAGRAMDFWLIGLTLAEISAIGAAVELGIAILCTRAPGMSLNRMPILAWTMLAVSFLIVVAFIPLLVATVMLELDRSVGTAFFDPTRGGDALLWQHLFWIFGHPEVYVMFLPGAAVISHVIPVHSRQRLVAYPLIIVALAATAVMSLGLWVHHMYTTGLPALTLSFFTAASMAIALASGVQIFAWIATLWIGKPRFTVPMLYSLGFIVTFVLGGITGVMVASVSFDQQVHDTYFVVAHFHYVLIGGMLFPVFAALHHWWAKFTGRRYSERAGMVGFWLVFGGFHLTFFPMHLSGLWGMPRRVAVYPDELGVDVTNLLSTVGAFVLAAGIVVLVANLVHSRLRGEASPEDPWGGDTLEWATTSPPPSENFPRIPLVTSRSPLWDPPADEDERRELVGAFDYGPSHVRATPKTSVITAAPEGAVLISGPTFWPIVPAAGLALVGALVLARWYVAAAIALLVVLVGAAGWAWSSETRQRAHPIRPAAGEYPFEAPGARSIGWWGAAATSAVAVIALATFAFSAMYLQVDAAVWPPGDTVDEPLLSALVLVLLVAATAVAWWGARRGRRTGWHGPDAGTRRVHLGASIGALALTVAALVVAVVLWTDGDLVPSEDAYQSSAWTLLAVHIVLSIVVLGMGAITVLARLRHERDSRPGLLLQCTALLSGTLVVSWLVVWAVTELFPRLAI